MKPLLEWFDGFPKTVKDIIRTTGMFNAVKALKFTYCDRHLIRALSHFWWDTTHTFHFPSIGEMTMTPVDFAAITGLRCSGDPIPIDMEICADASRLQLLVGDGWEIFHNKRKVTFKLVLETYKGYRSNTMERKNHLVRVFLATFLGTTIFCDTSTSSFYTWWISAVAATP